MKIPSEIRNLVDQLGQAMVRAVMADEVGRELIHQIQETGFDVGVLLEASVALHPKEEPDNFNESLEKTSVMANPHQEAAHEPSNANYEWSEQDKALMCSFRISLE